jgi:hypothetical protein
MCSRSRRKCMDAITNRLHRGRYLPSQARPVDSSRRRSAACSDFVGREKIGSEAGIGNLEEMYHIDQQQQCSSDSRIVQDAKCVLPEITTGVKHALTTNLSYCIELDFSEYCCPRRGCRRQAGIHLLNVVRSVVLKILNRYTLPQHTVLHSNNSVHTNPSSDRKSTNLVTDNSSILCVPTASQIGYRGKTQIDKFDTQYFRSFNI